MRLKPVIKPWTVFRGLLPSEPYFYVIPGILIAFAVILVIAELLDQFVFQLWKHR